VRVLVWCALAVPALALGAQPPPTGWLGEELPLPLAVHTPEDLKFKATAEKQYLVFNLLAAGKLAYDKGDFVTASAKWDALLRVPGLSPELDAALRPWAKAAREKSGGAAPAEAVEPAAAAAPPPSEKRSPVSIGGIVSGGGTPGPGGAVVFLRRLDGPNPKPKEEKLRVVAQKDKRFIPHVLVVTLGTEVEFRNEDPLFHNVFSLSKPNDFDLGLYRSGTSKNQKFDTAGAVQLLCNIHSSMIGWVYVVDTPWFGQADAAGRFTIKGVPPGEYRMSVWHELASKLTERKIHVAEPGEQFTVAVDADKGTPAFVPDKAGKPRQMQLGY
jgi:plastocyanin